MNALMKNFIDPKLLRLIMIFLSHDDEIFHLQKVSSRAKVPISTTHRLISILVKAGLVRRLKIGQFKIYKTDKKAAKIMRRAIR